MILPHRQYPAVPQVDHQVGVAHQTAAVQWGAGTAACDQPVDPLVLNSTPTTTPSLAAKPGRHYS